MDKAELERYATTLDREVALDLDGAFGWFGAHEDDPTFRVSHHDLQQFLHYTLPRKYLVGVEEHLAVARAMGDALEHLGAPVAYAELCRAPETLALLRLWAVDEDAAFERFVAYTEASGFEPPDTEELQWQAMMGMAEAQTRDAAIIALERALESGDGRPAAEIVREVLAEPDPGGTHTTRLVAVQAERIERWAGWRDSPRRALLAPLVGDITDAQVPDWPADDLLDWLLDEARAGLALTERGALSRALAIEVGRRRPDWTWGKPPRSESDVPHLEILHAALRGSGLLRRRGRKLLATRRAHQMTPGARRVLLLEDLLEGHTFFSAVAELTLAALAQGAPEADDRVAEAIAAQGWKDESGTLPSYAVPSTMADVRRLLLAIDAAEGGVTDRRACTLTELGRVAVLCALRAHAMRPAPPPSFEADEGWPDDENELELRADRVGLALPPVPGGAPPHLSPADDDDRAELIRLAHPDLARAIDAGRETCVVEGTEINPRLHLLMHEIVAHRLLYDDPPEDWALFEALLARGVDVHEAQHAVGQHTVTEMFEEFGPPADSAPPPRARPAGDRRARDRRKAQRAARRRNRR